MTHLVSLRNSCCFKNLKSLISHTHSSRSALQARHITSSSQNAHFAPKHGELFWPSCQGRQSLRSRRFPVSVGSGFSQRSASNFTNMEPASCRLIDSSNVQDFVDSFDTVLTDCDGVLWNDNDSIEGAPETIQMLKKMGKRVFYVTNNSSKTREEYSKKCAKLGFPAETEEIIGSAYTVARYIKDVLKYTGKVYLIGGQGLVQELNSAGLTCIGTGKDETKLENMNLVEMASLPLDPEVKCVVVGLDMNFNFAKLQKAQAYLNQPGCHFIASNTDSVLPLGDNRLFPASILMDYLSCGNLGKSKGTGAIVGCVEIAARRKAIVCGKPNKPIFEVAHEKHNLDPAKTIMIGDRCNTDIELAHNCGLRGLLVLTGYNTLEDVEQLKASSSPEDLRQVPHYYLPKLGDLRELINKNSQ